MNIISKYDRIIIYSDIRVNMSLESCLESPQVQHTHL